MRVHERRSASDDERHDPAYGGRFVYWDLPWVTDPVYNGPTSVVVDALAAREGGFMSRLWAGERAASAALTLALQANDKAARQLAVCQAARPLWNTLA